MPCIATRDLFSIAINALTMTRAYNLLPVVGQFSAAAPWPVPLSSPPQSKRQELLCSDCYGYKIIIVRVMPTYGCLHDSACL